MSARDPQLERLLLKATVLTARDRHGAECRPYVGAVEERLALGEERFGNGAFLRRDNLRELLEETPDVAGYALLTLQSPVEQADPTIFRELRQVMLYGALADQHARRALHARGPWR